ncbi:vitamin B12 dependent-methionine synthase activation domain-containing protein [Hydrogenoanaerobacterium sp.]|uniref:vitamin B12 dependent-methionine synthase activation domain-containing protein n=1 Tax=Hydrogenoanaerobacterium sp. TaxID=2953763 RepID=UPI00289D3E66|nr:vitamin B12 dependent-methionine synthase activation domain-containing protein [Hydrogenoanaerobacterium sp.]
MKPIVLDAIPVEEVLRYLGCSKESSAMTALAESCSAELLAAAVPRWLYRVFDLIPAENESGVALAQCGFVLPGADITALLKHCEQAVLLCATLSLGVDNLLRRAQLTDMSRGVVLDSCATAAVEVLCDQVQAEIEVQFPGCYFTMRYSPGYGDLPLTIQKDFLQLLDAPKQIGLCATESCILTPHKSVTAVIGIAKQPINQHKRSCQTCNLRETCAFRKREEYCGL